MEIFTLYGAQVEEMSLAELEVESQRLAARNAALEQELARLDQENAAMEAQVPLRARTSQFLYVGVV